MPGAGNPQAWNRYAYTINNPINNIDPSGHAPICDEDGYCYSNQKGKYQVQLRSIHGINGNIPESTDLATAIDSGNDQLVDSLSEIAAASQAIAAAIDTGFAIGGTIIIAGECALAIEVGCLPGAIAGFLEVESAYLLWGNPMETFFSAVSSALTITADVIEDGKLGDASATSITAFVTGTILADPWSDAAIDIYGTGYSFGIFNGLSEILNGVVKKQKR